MTKYQLGDIECSAVPQEGGKFRARVRVDGFRLEPAQVRDYVYESPELFETANLALLHGKSHANEHFPPE